MQRNSRKSNSVTSTPTVKNTRHTVNSASLVRIIGGRLKRQSVPFIDAEGLRPTPNRLRETLFNWIQFELHDAIVLDAFSGSGVLGFEALSRGARHITFIELQSNQASLIKQSAAKFKLTPQEFCVHTGDALKVIPTLNLDKPFRSNQLSSQQQSMREQTNKSVSKPYYNLVFLDPPYAAALWQPVIKALIKQQLVSSHTLFYIEDNCPLSITLLALPYDITIIKEAKIGQVYASLVTIC